MGIFWGNREKKIRSEEVETPLKHCFSFTEINLNESWMPNFYVSVFYNFFFITERKQTQMGDKVKLKLFFFFFLWYELYKNNLENFKSCKKMRFWDFKTILVLINESVKPNPKPNFQRSPAQTRILNLVSGKFKPEPEPEPEPWILGSKAPKTT